MNPISIADAAWSGPMVIPINAICCVASTAIIDAETAITAPTDRSIPAPMITMVWPTARIIK
jgi:hypothetical protein